MTRDQGAVSIRKTVLPGMAIPMLKIRRPNGRLIFNMEITIHTYDGLYINNESTGMCEVSVMTLSTNDWWAGEVLRGINWKQGT